MPRDRFIRSAQRDKIRAERADDGDNGREAMKLTWRQTNADQLKLVVECLALPGIFPDQRTFLEAWASSLRTNPLFNLTVGRVGLVKKIMTAIRLNAGNPERVRPPPASHKSFGPNPAFKKTRAPWLDDPALLPKSPPKRL